MVIKNNSANVYMPLHKSGPERCSTTPLCVAHKNLLLATKNGCFWHIILLRHYILYYIYYVHYYILYIVYYIHSRSPIANKMLVVHYGFLYLFQGCGTKLQMRFMDYIVSITAGGITITILEVSPLS